MEPRIAAATKAERIDPIPWLPRSGLQLGALVLPALPLSRFRGQVHPVPLTSFLLPHG
jgi:hypothetical protein